MFDKPTTMFYEKNYFACKSMESMIKCLRKLNIVTFNNDYCKGGNYYGKGNNSVSGIT